MEKENKLVFVAKDGFPVERIINRPILSFFRLLIHTKKIMKYETWLKKGGCKINFN